MKPSKINAFKQQMNSDCVIGIFSKTCDGSFIESSGKGGMDFCILDMEHGPVSYEHLPDLIRACECSNTLPIVRVADNCEEYISKALDLGAAGIQIPQINDSEAARDAIRHAKFFPEGNRGVCRYVRAAEYSSLDKSQYFKEANLAMVILQIEGIQGIHNLDEILSVPGIDIIFIGPYDLSQSLGVPGDVHHPKVIEQMRIIIQKADAFGISVGTFVDTPKDALYWKSLGIKYIANSVDVGIFYDACREITSAIRTS